MRTIACKLGKHDFGKWTMNVSACAIDEYCEEGVDNPLPSPTCNWGFARLPVLGSTNLYPTSDTKSIQPADTNVFPFSGGEKGRPQIRLCT